MFMQFTVFQNSGIAYVLLAKLHMIQIAQFLFMKVLIILVFFFHLMLFLNVYSGGETGTLVFTGQKHLIVLQ